MAMTERAAGGVPDLSRFDLYCFDNDGTIFRSDEVANPAIKKEFVLFTREAGLELPEPSDARILELTGSPGPVFYRALLPPELADRAEEFRTRCIDREVEEVLARGRFFEGARELLEELAARGRKRALVSNGGHRYIGACAERLGYDQLFEGIYHFGKDGMESKAEMIRCARADLGAETVVMIGDRASDRDAAREAGIPFVGCSFGYGAADELDGAVGIAGSIDKLGQWFLG